MLLRAGADEAPSSRAVERTVAALGAGAATLGVVTAASSAPAIVGAATATSLGVAGTVKLLAIGAVAGLASGGALLGVTKAVEQSASKPVAAVVPAVSVAAPVEAVPLPPALVPEAPPAVEPPAVEAPAPRPAATSAPSVGSPLAAEVALVDRAHGVLRSGNARGALAILAAYESSFESPRLLPEVFALRMEASERAGDEVGARKWASRLVSRYPRSAQAARARTLLEGPAEGER
jgi:hypothetical protein